MILTNIFIFIGFFLCYNTHQTSNLNAILISTSKYWFNYRQASNILLIYHRLKEFGVSDENIILMVPESTACNSRNNEPGILSCFDGTTIPNLYKNFELDYKALDVNVENIINLIRGRFPEGMPESKKIHSNSNSRLLLYITGHGGNQYSKIQDTHVISSYDYAKIIEELSKKQGYKEILAINDSCESVTIWDDVTSSNFFGIGSSIKGERSYSYGKDKKLKLAKVDKFSYLVNQFLSEKFSLDRNLNIKDLLNKFDPAFLGGKSASKNNFAKKSEKDIYIKDFFSNQNNVIRRSLNLNQNNEEEDYNLKEIQDIKQFDELINEIELNEDDLKIKNKINYSKNEGTIKIFKLF